MVISFINCQPSSEVSPQVQVVETSKDIQSISIRVVPWATFQNLHDLVAFLMTSRPLSGEKLWQWIHGGFPEYQFLLPAVSIHPKCKRRLLSRVEQGRRFLFYINNI